MMKNRTYKGEFSGWKDVAESFAGNCPKVEPRFVFAEYEVPGYEGYSTVITSADGRKFSVVEGGHCSCFGLEGQWETTEHNKTEIKKMMKATWGFFHQNREDLMKWFKHITQ